MIDLAILVPVLSRPWAVAPLVASIIGSAPGARIIFIADPDDEDEHEAVRRARHGDAVIELLLRPGSYAAKINAAICRTEETLLFLGADDLRFRPGWREAAERRLHPAQVVGVNDLLRRRRVHTTHFLITRAYAARGTIDGQPGPLSEAYEHNFVDDELIATAKCRGVYAYAEDAHVEHLHPMNGRAEIDSTYRRGFEAMQRDRRVFQARRPMWT